VRDLSDDLDLTLNLLVDSRAWKHRLVEQIQLSSAVHYVVRRSFQVELPVEALRHRVPYDEDTVRVMLPLTTLPKSPLLNFDLVGPEGRSAPLELRRSGAAVQAQFLAALASGAGLSDVVIDRCFPESLLEAVCAFTPGPYASVLEACGNDHGRALSEYLCDGLGFEVDGAALDSAIKRARWAGARLGAALEEPEDLLSSSENVLLALPLMDDGAPSSSQEVHGLVSAFHDGVAVAHALAADDFLATLAEYGRRWEAFAEVHLQSGTPNLIKIVDQRPLVLRRPPRLWDQGLDLRLNVAIGEPASYHLAVAVEDGSLRLHSWHFESVDGADLPVALFEGIKETP
jgi:hypothetical protein